MSEIVANWNARPSLGISNHIDDSQEFASDILKALGDIPKVPPHMKLFYDHLLLSGSARLKFYLTDEIRQKYGLKEEMIVFATHSDLVELTTLFLQDPYFVTSFPNEFAFLHDCDRVFHLQIKHLRNKIDEIEVKLVAKDTLSMLNLKKDLIPRKQSLKLSGSFISFNSLEKSNEDDKRKKLKTKLTNLVVECPFNHFH